MVVRDISVSNTGVQVVVGHEHTAMDGSKHEEDSPMWEFLQSMVVKYLSGVEQIKDLQLTRVDIRGNRSQFSFKKSKC